MTGKRRNEEEKEAAAHTHCCRATPAKHYASPALLSLYLPFLQKRNSEKMTKLKARAAEALAWRRKKKSKLLKYKLLKGGGSLTTAKETAL